MILAMDQSFGPQLPGYFDFTLRFEQIFFAIVPSAIAILAALFFARKLATHSCQVRPGWLLWLKLAGGTAIGALHLAGIVLWKRSEFHSGYSLAASILSFIAALCNLLTLHAGHTRYLHPSAFLSLFFTITMLFDIAITRSLYMRHLETLGAIQAVIAVSKFCLASLEEVSKRQLFHSETLRAILGGETVAGFWNRSFFFWANLMLAQGFRKDLTVDGLPELDPKFHAPVLYDRFQEHWTRGNKTPRMAIFNACLRTIMDQFLSYLLPRLCFIGFSLSRPFLMQRVLDAVNNGSDSQEIRIGLIAATILVFGGVAISKSIYMRIEYQINVCLRAILIVAIYDKTQLLNTEELEKDAAVTLMSTDVSGVQQVMVMLHETWSAVVELGLGVYFLYKFVGLACFLIFVPGIIATTATYFNAKRFAKARKQWNESIQGRVAATSTILNQLKSIKAMGLSEALGEYLQEKRRGEVQTSMHDRHCRIRMFGIAAFASITPPVFVFAGARFWTRASNPMSASEVFSAFAMIILTASPWNTLLYSLTSAAASFACMARIQAYLNLEELDDSRKRVESDEEKNVSDTNEKDNAHPPASQHAVVMDRVTIKSKKSNTVLSEMSIKIARGKLAMVRGQVGSGKSVFLRTILGEVQPASGTVLAPPSKEISYAAQKPWIRNLSIKDNVIGPNPYDESLYNEVIHACALDKDIAEFANGDETMTGTDGCNLSGGQKQRLALARSLFNDASTLVLDDVLSSLDAETSSVVFSRLFGPDGFTRKRNTTVIMTTNRVDLLGSADMVFEIKEDGQLQEQDVSQFISLPRPVEAAEGLDELKQESKPATGIAKSSAVGESKNSNDSEPKSQSRRNGDFSLYGYFLRSAGAAVIFGWIAVTAVNAVVEKMPEIYLKIWYNTDPQNDVYFVGFALMSFTVMFYTASTGAFYFLRIIPKSSTELHWRLLRSVMGATLTFINQTDTGSSLNRFSQDISLVSQTLPIVFMQAVFICFSVLVDIGVICSGAKYASPIMIFLLLLLYGIQYFYLRTSRQLRLLELESTSPFFSHFKEASSGMEHIRAFGWQRQFKDDFCALLQRAQRPFYYLFAIQRWLTFVLDLTSCFVATILVSISLSIPHSTSATALGLALLNLIGFSSTASHFITVWVGLETCLGGVARIKTFCEETPQETDQGGASDLPEEWPTTGKIEFTSVSAGYECEDGSFRQALDKTTVTIDHGEKVGIAGRTGSGKSSMFLAILHMIECSGGSILIDGRDIATVPRERLRSRITTMTQDGVEVKATLRYNLYPFAGPKPTDELMVETLKRVEIWDYIASQENGGLDSEMADVGLSQGQKQLFFVARAILHQATNGTKLVIVDEATSSMDYDVDERMQKVMDEAFAGCTVVVIAHRPHVLESAKTVIHLDSGKVATITRRGQGEVAAPQCM